MAGRLVCQNCGLAAGSRAARSTPRNGQRSSGKLWLVLLLLTAIVVVVIMS